MVKLIDGKSLAEKVKDKIALEVLALKGNRPNLAIILVGEREDSKLYVSLKEKEAVKVGIDTHIYRLDEDVSEEELLKVVDFLNKDELIDGILLQLPLPKNLDANKIIKKMDPEKDVDGFHPNKSDFIISPVLAAVGASLKDTKINFQGKKACLLFNSSIFGKELETFLIGFGFSEFLKTENSNQADLIVTAVAKPGSLKEGNVKEGAVLIDISTVKKDKKVLGDVDFESVKNKAAFLTPVPGGIGPMTIAFLLENTLNVFKHKNK